MCWLTVTALTEKDKHPTKMNPKADALITFFYYRDLAKAADFYEKIMGFDLVVDQGWAKIYRVNGSALMGCVDGNIGYHKPNAIKPVMLTVVVDDPDAWYSHFENPDSKASANPTMT